MKYSEVSLPQCFPLPQLQPARERGGGRIKVMLITMASSYIIYCYVCGHISTYCNAFANFVRIYSLINIKLNV